MALRGEQLNLFYARKREQEQRKIEKTEALYRYYDHWGKVTSRHTLLAGPDYYKDAENKFNKLKINKEKQIQLEKRREKLSELLKQENDLWNKEIDIRQKPKKRYIPENTETLLKINQNVKEQENIRRKLELEAKLYGKWRHGVNDENLIFESRSNNEVLAKLNWLDRQIAEQEQREKEQKENAERDLKMQIERNKMAEIQKEREKLREKELMEIREYQDQHLKELQTLQTESENLSSKEKKYRTSLDELEKELELILESSQLIGTSIEESPRGYNLKNIKVLIRKRSEIVREVIKICCSVLERISSYSLQMERVKQLKENYLNDLENEEHTLPLIDAMYESEAKCNLQKAEEAWCIAHKSRIQQIKALIEEEERLINARLDDNLQQQEELVKLRTAHLNAIEASNENLKKLMKEQDNEVPQVSISNVSTSVNSANVIATEAAEAAVATKVSESSLTKITNSFTNLNLDVWKDLDEPNTTTRTNRNRLSASSISDRSSNSSLITEQNAQRPKFARKRVAWN